MEPGDSTDIVLSAISAVASRSKLWEIIFAFYARHGIAMVTYQAVFADGSSKRVVADGFPEGFLDTYIEQKLSTVDPVHQLGIQSCKPFRWKDIRKLTEITVENDRFLKYAREEGLSDGLAFGVFGPNLQNAFVGLGFGPDTPEPSDGLVLAFQLVAQAGHLKYCDFDKNTRKAPQLTRREQETLEWVARGKSNSVIAQIMGISPHTVDTNLRRIYTKLDVTDRTTATIRGLGSGVLHPPQVVT